MPAERGIPSTLPKNKCQLGLVSKYRHHSFPNAPHSPVSAIPAPSHSLWGRSLSRCCPGLAWPHLPQLCCSLQVKPSCVPALHNAPHSVLPTKSLPKSSFSISRGEFAGLFRGGSRGLGFLCVWALCVSHPSSSRFLPASSRAQGNLSLCSFGAIWCNFPATTGEILGANVCWRLFRDLNLTETKARLSYN